MPSRDDGTPRDSGTRRPRPSPSTALPRACDGSAAGQPTAWRRETPPNPDPYAGVEYDQGNLERGHAIVTVVTGQRLADAESLLRAFGGRGVHVRAVEEPETTEPDATMRMETVV